MIAEMIVHGRIALMGSGELTPSMVEIHKQLLATMNKSQTALFLDTPAGFQPNSDDISQKAQEYFHQNVQHKMEVASFKSAENAEEYDIQLLLKQLGRAGYLLVGPGSPTYMLRQLEGSALLDSMKEIVSKGGCLAIASAAALTAGKHTLPVYEIYKVGEQLHWQRGLNILKEFGLDIVVVPHWNNAEGGTHDTRFCYMGERRFVKLRKLLPEETIYIGIDEHTACILNFEADIAEIRGRGGITLIQGNRELSYAKGEEFPLEVIRRGLLGSDSYTSGKKSIKESLPLKKGGASFWDHVHSLKDQFQEGIKDQDYKSSARAILDLESHISQSAVTSESDEDVTKAREINRDLIVLLSIELQEMQHLLEQYYKPLIESVLHLRNEYKMEQKWPEADALRDIMEKLKIHIEDTKEGSRWHL